jgi:hypothetical protein
MGRRPSNLLTFGTRWFPINLDEPDRALAAVDAPVDEPFAALEYEGDVLTDAADIRSRVDQAAVLPTGLIGEHQSLTVIQASDPKDMSATFVIVTRGTKPNRHGNIVEIMPSEYGQGMLLDEYQTNPVVLLDHGFGFPLPIGRSADRAGKFTVTAQKTKMTATAFFSQRLPEAAAVFALIDEGILQAASVGYSVQLARMLKPEPPKRGDDPETMNLASAGMGLHFVQSTLMEWSVVAVGADAGALRKVQDRGHAMGEKLTPTVRQWLAKATSAAPVWSPGVTFAAEQPVIAQAVAIDEPKAASQNSPQVDLVLLAQRLTVVKPVAKQAASTELATRLAGLIDQKVGSLVGRVDALGERLTNALGG